MVLFDLLTDYIFSRYSVGDELAKGGFGVVYEGRRLDDGLEVSAWKENNIEPAIVCLASSASFLLSVPAGNVLVCSSGGFEIRHQEPADGLHTHREYSVETKSNTCC